MKTYPMSPEKFEQFLKNIYSKLKGKEFKSVKSYQAYIRKALKYIGIDAVKFFNASLTDIKVWEFKIRDNQAFKGLSPEYKSDILSGYHAYVTFMRYECGFIKPNM